MKKTLRYAIVVLSVVVLAGLVVGAAVFVPWCFDHGDVTLVHRTKEMQVAAAKALAQAIGNPVIELNDESVERYIFAAGTSVDYVRMPAKTDYDIVALKSVVIGFWSSETPLEVADRMKRSLEENKEETVQIVHQPDPAIPSDECILILASKAFYFGNGVGYATLIRKHAWHMHGPKAQLFKSFSAVHFFSVNPFSV